jgi:hypothetical protein
MSHAWVRKLLTVLAIPAAIAGCGFVQSAGDIEVSSPTIPKVSYDLQWPKVDDLIGGALKQGNARLPGAPTSLQAATLAHVQGLMTIDGNCHRALVQEKVTAVSGTLRHLTVDLTNCGDPGRCVARCEGFHGMRLEARVQIQLLDDDKAGKIKKAFPKPADDAVAQIRARFSKLEFYQTDAGKKVDVGRLFANYELGLSSPGGGDDTVLVSQRYLSRITPQTPQRFELDPTSPFTQKVKKTVLAGQAQWIEVFQRIDVAQRDLYAVRLGGAGVQLDFQPELVINAIEVGKEYLK